MRFLPVCESCCLQLCCLQLSNTTRVLMYSCLNRNCVTKPRLVDKSIVCYGILSYRLVAQIRLGNACISYCLFSGFQFHQTAIFQIYALVVLICVCYCVSALWLKPTARPQWWGLLWLSWKGFKKGSKCTHLIWAPKGLMGNCQCLINF